MNWSEDCSIEQYGLQALDKAVLGDGNLVYPIMSILYNIFHWLAILFMTSAGIQRFIQLVLTHYPSSSSSSSSSSSTVNVLTFNTLRWTHLLLHSIFYVNMVICLTLVATFLVWENKIDSIVTSLLEVIYLPLVIILEFTLNFIMVKRVIESSSSSSLQTITAHPPHSHTARRRTANIITSLHYRLIIYLVAIFLSDAASFLLAVLPSIISSNSSVSSSYWIDQEGVKGELLFAAVTWESIHLIAVFGILELVYIGLIRARNANRDQSRTYSGQEQEEMTDNISMLVTPRQTAALRLRDVSDLLSYSSYSNRDLSKSSTGIAAVDCGGGTCNCHHHDDIGYHSTATELTVATTHTTSGVFGTTSAWKWFHG